MTKIQMISAINNFPIGASAETREELLAKARVIAELSETQDQFASASNGKEAVENYLSDVVDGRLPELKEAERTLGLSNGFIQDYNKIAYIQENNPEFDKIYEEIAKSIELKIEEEKDNGEFNYGKFGYEASDFIKSQRDEIELAKKNGLSDEQIDSFLSEHKTATDLRDDRINAVKEELEKAGKYSYEQMSEAREDVLKAAITVGCSIEEASKISNLEISEDKIVEAADNLANLREYEKEEMEKTVEGLGLDVPERVKEEEELEL